MNCAYTCATDAYDGNKNLCVEQNATAPASPPVAGVDRIGVYEAICDWIRNDVGLGVQMGLTPDATKKLVARIEALASPVSGDGSSADADTHRAADGAVLADGRDVSGETVMGMRVAAYRHPIDCPAGTDRVAWNDFFRGEPPNTYSEHWSTPGAHRKDVERLFTEADVRARFAALAPPAVSRSPGMETLQASECTKHGEGEQ